MGDRYNTDLSALNIFEKYHGIRKRRDRDKDGRQYFSQLRAAMLKELKDQGHCSLIDAIIQEKPKRLDVITTVAIYDTKANIKNNTGTDVREIELDPIHIPYFKDEGRKVLWSEANDYSFPIDYVLSIIREMQETLNKEPEISINLNRNTERTAEEQAESLMAQTRQQAESLMAQTRQQAESLMAQTRQQAESLMAQTRQQAENVRAQTRQQAESVRVQTEQQAESLIDQAHSDADRIREEARRQAREITNESKRQAEISAKKRVEILTARYLADEQRAYKAKLNQEMEKFTDSSLTNSSRAMTIHSQMCDATNDLQVHWIKTLDEFAGRLTEVKSELYSFLHNWQTSLFPNEIKPIAERYLELYRILNVDKLLREEILLDSLGKGEDVQAEPVEHEDEASPSAIRIAGLQKLNGTLTTFLRKFELSLNGLDLYVYYPHPGDVFDEILHLPESEDEDYTDRRITECVIPGIAKKANDSFGDDVLIPAVVKVENESEV